MSSRHQQVRTLVGIVIVLGALAVPRPAAAQSCADAANGMSFAILDEMYYAGEAMSWASDRDAYDSQWQYQWQSAPPPQEEQDTHDATIAGYNAVINYYAWMNGIATATYDSWNAFYSNPANGCVAPPPG